MGVCDFPLMDKVCGAVDFATNPAGTVTDGLGAWIAKSAGELASSAADLAAKAVNKTTAIDLNAGWFRDNYELLLPIGLALTVGIFCIQLMTAAWRRDERALAKAAFGTMTGVLFSFSAIAFTTVAITVVDALSDGLFKAANTSIDDAIRRVIKVDQMGAMYGLGWGVPALVAFGCAIGAFLYWGVMVARKVGVLIMVALAVFAGAGGGWEVAKRWRRGWIEATGTLIVSKLLMTVVFLIGVSAMGKTDASDGMAALSDAMAGIVVMVLVLLCPYATYKFVHWASDGGGHDDMHRTGVAGMAGNLSKEGIDAGPPKQQTRFRYGEDPDVSGDKGRALIQRPGIPPLITRPGEDEPEGSESAAQGVAGGSGHLAAASAPGGDMTSMPPADPGPSASGTPASGSGPSATGSATPTNWVYPTQPPSGS
ncbi:ATP-binding protein [Streptomyces sp. MBT97]|uniref:SCO6881 family protein n=1 Tax=Streptomyces sp. MBT97 TaxID=2800411 RepID=UPI00190CE097|nr:ATP-binding protein [Streptomyces sp. MBT97]MBK3633160.1 ATP-binding protein [Streptomyces sp. MBT97]